MSLYSYISIVQQGMPENGEEIAVYNTEHKNDYKTEMTLVRLILKGVEHVFKVF